MVLTTLSVLVAFGAVVGASEGIQASQRRARREEHRSRKNHLTVHCPKSSAYAPLLEGRRVVLSGGRLYVDTSDSVDPDAPFGHPFAGYYLPYPEARHAGLVSTITDIAPIMNWVFVDRTSYALCYGPRAAAEGQVTGPWDCTRQDRRLTLGGWEGFVAVRLPPDIGGGFWALYFDCAADRLQAQLAAWPPGTVAVEVELARREMRMPAPVRAEEGEGDEAEGEGADEARTEKQVETETEKPAGKETEKTAQTITTAGEEREATASTKDGTTDRTDATRGEQGWTAEQVAELQRRLQAAESSPRAGLAASGTQATRRDKRAASTAAKGNGSSRPRDEVEATRSPSTSPSPSPSPSRSRGRGRRRRRSNRSSTSTQSVGSGQSSTSVHSRQSGCSQQHSIRSAATGATSTTGATTADGTDNTDNTDNTDDDYSSSVYSAYFDSPSRSSRPSSPKGSDPNRRRSSSR